MRRTGTVVMDGDGRLKARVTRPAECERCGMCDQRWLLLDLPQGDWKPGDTVDIDMPADKVLKASALAYLMPLALLLAGLLLGGPVGRALGTDGDITRLVLGLVLMAAGFGLVKLIAPRLKRKGALDMQMTPCGQDAKAIAMAAFRPDNDKNNGGK